MGELINMNRGRIQRGLLAVCAVWLIGCGNTSKYVETVEETTIEEIQIEVPTEQLEPEIMEMNWSDYFDGFNGAAVFYTPENNQYSMYNMELGMTQRSPCSTFKIVSSLIGLESEVIVPDQSKRTWSGERFWNEKWNQDVDFQEAFSGSCVWYYREVIDEIGPEIMRRELERLQYGNQDISDWQGRLNTNNQNPALTGFWIESSLKISPKEQAEVLERIFGTQSIYGESSIHQLKQAMKITGAQLEETQIYGKTGMGKANGVTVDAWYAGFVEIKGEQTYFCVYLGESAGMNVSSAAAKEIAIELIKEVTIS